MNYNAKGPEGEPSVYLFYEDGGDFDRVTTKMEKLFSKLQTINPNPSVDWTETDRLDTIYFREECQSASEGGMTTETILGRNESGLYVYKRTKHPGSESIQKARLNEPRIPAEAEISRFGYRPPLFRVDLDDLDGSLFEESTESATRANGSWENLDCLEITIHSASRERLEQLWADLAAARAKIKPRLP